ncbi:hypothetical protein [Ottowia sp.]|uniref:hypothetical protein n=1 Tax=Ottowia sp. TaxID=1898956 RepID=UPI0025D3F728|nr:hypothetical protein [Ottowia sp.]MBK6616303.1 hypothetical protein [Ottowia sp.]
MRQLHLRFTPASGNQPLFALQWRKAVSEQMTRTGRSPAAAHRLFHHWHEFCPEEASGRDKAGVCFVSSTRWVGVIASGDESIQLLREHMTEFVLAANAALGACAVEHHDRVLNFVPGNRLYDYVIPQHVSKDHDGQPHTTAFLHGKIVRALNDWAERFELEPAFTSGDILITNFQRLSPAMNWSRTSERWAKHRTRVEFSMPFKLDGYWAAGSLASKGYSFVQFARSPVDSEGGVQ